MSTVRMLRCTGSATARRGRLPLNGDTEPFTSSRLAAGRPSSARTGAGATMTAAHTAATMKRDRLCPRRDLAAPSRSGQARRVGGRAGKAKDAWLPPQRTYVVKARTGGIVSLKSNLTTLDSFPSWFDAKPVKHVKLANSDQTL